MKLNLKKILPILGAFLLAVALATGSFFAGQWYKGKNLPIPQEQPESCGDCINPLPAPDTSGWKTYRNEELGFEIRYPEAADVGINVEAIDSTDRLNVYFEDYNEACRSGELEGCGGGAPPKNLITFKAFPQQLLRAVADNAFHNNNPFFEPNEFYVGIYDPKSFGGSIENADLTGKSGIKWARDRSYSGGIVKNTHVMYQGFISGGNGDQVVLIVFSDKYHPEFYLNLTDSIVSTFKLSD